ncbi:hypothetical protein PQQ96_31615 [Paraburkholderia sediminicola]|uniref:hypothetical protein n=1 Tax=Paraburkholderia sediminicola TaxID=458836 RepID=UPI0038BD1D10
MSSLNIRQYAVTSPDDRGDTSHRATLTGRQAVRRRTLALTVVSAAVAAIAIAAGLPSMGIAVYLAATLPFAFFS